MIIESLIKYDKKWGFHLNHAVKTRVFGQNAIDVSMNLSYQSLYFGGGIGEQRTVRIKGCRSSSYYFPR